MFLKNKNIIFKIRRSKVTDYAALNVHPSKHVQSGHYRPIVARDWMLAGMLIKTCILKVCQLKPLLRVWSISQSICVVEIVCQCFCALLIRTVGSKILAKCSCLFTTITVFTVFVRRSSYYICCLYPHGLHSLLDLEIKLSYHIILTEPFAISIC